MIVLGCTWKESAPNVIVSALRYKGYKKAGHTAADGNSNNSERPSPPIHQLRSSPLTSTNAMSLTALPNEILLRILQYNIPNIPITSTGDYNLWLSSQTVTKRYLTLALHTFWTSSSAVPTYHHFLGPHGMAYTFTGPLDWVVHSDQHRAKVREVKCRTYVVGGPSVAEPEVGLIEMVPP